MYSGSSQVVYCPSYYFDDSFTSTRCLYLSQSQLWVIKRISTSYARAHAHTRPRAYACGRTLAARSSRQTMLGGGLSLQTLSSEERLRCAPFLTVLGTHCISRSFPLPPQRMLASLAAVSVAAGPASHAHPVASKRPRNQTAHAYAVFCGACPQSRSARLHRMRVAGNTLEASCCRTRRRRCAKHRLRRPPAADGARARWARRLAPNILPKIDPRERTPRNGPQRPRAPRINIGTWSLCDCLCLVLVCRGRYGLGGRFFSSFWDRVWSE